MIEVLDTLDEEDEEFGNEELLRELELREAEGLKDSVPWSILRDRA